MSETSKLKLYKADPITNPDEVFNFDTILNDNWEKIDQTVETKDGAQTKANTAEQAAIDWAKGYGLGDRTYQISFDWNNLDSTGFYGGSKNGPLGSTSVVFGIHIEHNANHAYQVAARHNKSYARTKEDGVWQEWKELETAEGAQAKATEVKDWAKSMGLGTPSRFSGDLDTVTSNGLFYIGTDSANQPTAAGYLIHQHHPGMDYASQFFIDLHNQENYIRTKVNGTWGDWVKIAADNEVVHKSGDKMTGELESEARIWHSLNGVIGAFGWMKFEGDGTSLDYGTYMAHNALHDEAAGTWTFERSNIKASVIKTGPHSGFQVWESNNATIAAGDPITWDKKTIETTAGAQTKVDNLQDWIHSYGLGTQAKRIDYHIDNAPNGAGFFYLSNGASNGSPSGSNGYVLQQVYTSAYKKQIFMDVTTNKIFHRFSDNNGWRAWVQLANEGEDVSFNSVTVDGVDLKQSVSNGKQQVRDAVIGKGGTVADADSDGIPTFQELTDGVNGITTSAIKSIQRGNSSVFGDTRLVSISPVDLSKSIVNYLGYYMHSDEITLSGRNKVLAEFTASNEIRISSATDTNDDRYFSWEVIEFEEDVNIQSGYVEVTASAINVPISAVDLDKAVVFYTYRLDFVGSHADDVEWAVELTNSTTLNLRRGSTTTGERVAIQWFVVEFP